MKYSTILVFILLLVASCSSIDDSNDIAKFGVVSVGVSVNDYSVAMSGLPSMATRALTSVADYADVGELILAFYDADGTEAVRYVQVRADSATYSTFGEFQVTLPYGSYKMVAIARAVGSNDTIVLSSPTAAAYTSERVRETFSSTSDVTISNSSGANVGITLSRIITMLAVRSTDQRPEGVASFRTTYGKGSKSFNPTTGFALDDNGFSLTNTSKAEVGKPIGIGNYAFLKTDDETMDITLETLDAMGNVLTTRTIPDVPFRRNRQTTLRGPLFTTRASSSLDTVWESGVEITF